MKVMVAAGPTEGSQEGEFNHCVPGELVRFPFDACDCPDCGCERAMAGMASSKATTEFRVEDRPQLTAEKYREAFLEALRREGWLDLIPEEDKHELTAWADQHLVEAARFEDGDVLCLVNGEPVKRN